MVKTHTVKNVDNYREERMIKKIFMCLMLVLAFTACQSLNYIKEKNETIQLVVKGNDNNIYMLGNNYDYQFSGKDADRLLRLSNFPKELNFSREQLKNTSVNIHVDARDGSAELDFGSRITINKKSGNNANYEKEQKVFYENLKNELNRRKVRYKIEENSGEWVIVLLDVPYFQGKVVKLQNRSEFLEKGKGQFINVPSKLYLTDPPSQAVEGAVGGLMGAVVVPVKAVLAIPALIVLPFLVPFMKIGNTP